MGTSDGCGTNHYKIYSKLRWSHISPDAKARRRRNKKLSRTLNTTSVFKCPGCFYLFPFGKKERHTKTFSCTRCGSLLDIGEITIYDIIDKKPYSKKDTNKIITLFAANECSGSLCSGIYFGRFELRQRLPGSYGCNTR